MFFSFFPQFTSSVFGRILGLFFWNLEFRISSYEFFYATRVTKISELYEWHINRHYSIFDFRQRKFRQRVNKRCQKGYKQRFLLCCQVFTNSQISCTKPLPLYFGQQFEKRGHKKPLPLCFGQRFESVDIKNRCLFCIYRSGHEKPLPM
jgi:hypothetical protein